MIEESKDDADERMQKALTALETAFSKLRTGRAHPGILTGITVDYYGSETPIAQLANVTVEDARTLTIVPWEKKVVPDVERAILKSDLGLTPTTAGEVIRLPMPALTEENRRELTKVARGEAENIRVAIRNIRREANSELKEYRTEKEITEDEERRGNEMIQRLTDQCIAEVDKVLEAKEADLLEI